MTVRPRSLADRLRADETIVTAWSSLPFGLISELLGRAGYPAVTLDMQHGQHDIASVREGLAACRLGGAHRISRIPVGEFGTASRLLDLGAEAVIAPMINSVEDATTFAKFMKYPPVGERSWGPHRGAMLADTDAETYFVSANDQTLALAMIETPSAIEALDDILKVPGIDGVFVGPSDLSLTLSRGEFVRPRGALAQNAAEGIAAKTRAAGKIAGVFCMAGEDVPKARDMGFRLMAFGVDMSFITDAAAAALKSAEI